MPININEGAGAQLASDDAATPGQKIQRVKLQHGASGSAVDASGAAPLPVAEPTFAAALTSNGAVVAGAASAVLVAANAARKYIEIYNVSATEGVFLRFAAAAAAVNVGAYLPPKSGNRWAYSGEVRCIREAAANAQLTYVEW